MSLISKLSKPKLVKASNSSILSNKIKIDDSKPDNDNNNNNDNLNAFNYDSVSDLNSAIKDSLQVSFNKPITVTGELSNYKISNKNLYATLKDNESCISIIFWGIEYKKKGITFANGEIVEITGSITVYSKSGSYSLQLTDIKKIGKQVGNVHNQYELLKQKYNQLGYFNNKKPIPDTIKCIGIITALEGAALQDILYVLKKNNFVGKVIIKGCMVQGNQSISSIIKGIEFLSNNEQYKPDLILITRGGGSYEDLISYSSEEIIEAIYLCPIFTISAVGHEIDFMLSDFVADLRAPTPSIAAEIISQIQNKSLSEFNLIKKNIENDFYQKIDYKLKNMMNDLVLLKNKIADINENNNNNKINNSQNEIDKLKNMLISKINSKLNKLNNEMNDLQFKLGKYDMTKNMDDGYAVIVKGVGTVIDSVTDIKVGQKLKIKMKDGELDVIVI